jgi:hypothetical protein
MVRATLGVVVWAGIIPAKGVHLDQVVQLKLLDHNLNDDFTFTYPREAFLFITLEKCSV